jgi:hydroxymethylbilane synthase
MASRPLCIGTRGSLMALYQAGLVRDRLAAAHADLAAEGAIELVVIRTTGDRVQDRRLAEIGGKGLFTKEIEEALFDRRVDLAVHSLKDVETRLPEGLDIVCVLPRDDPRDAFLSTQSATFAGLPHGAVVGTASLRRRAQLLRRRPDLRVVPFRGNADTRLRKLDAGEVDATLLALSGLQRLGLVARVGEVLPPSVMLPAVGQGALAIECRSDHEEARRLLAPLHDPASAACVAAERAMLAALDGSCRTPIAGLATIDGNVLTLEGLLIAPDGDSEWRARLSGPSDDAATIGIDVGARLRRDAGPGFVFG